MTQVLIVDDNEQNLYFLTALLRGSGYTVQAAENGSQALDMARRNPPDLVVSDLLMPVMDGYALLRRWKTDPLLKGVRFIVYTATYTDTEDEKLAFELGADAFIVKPTEAEILLSRIQQVLAQGTNTPLIELDSVSVEESHLGQYNEVLVRKLEKKVSELEGANQALKREVEERQKMEKTQRGILDALAAQVALLDSRGDILAVNTAWREFANANGNSGAVSPVGLNYLDACADGTEDGAPQAADGIQKVLRGEASEFSMEYPCHSPTEQRWFRLIATPLMSEPASGAVVMHIDVTERKQREARLRESEERLQFVMSAANVGYWDVDLVTGRVTRSPQHDRCFGFAELQDHWDYDSFTQLMHWADRERVKLALQSAHDIGGSYDLEYRVVWSDGSVHWLLSVGQFVCDDAGRTVRASGIIMDITERKRIEEALVDSELELRGLAESMPQMVWTATPDGQSAYLNGRWTDYTGLSLDDSLQNGWLRAFHPEDAEPAYRSWQAALAGEGDYSLESRLRRSDGAYRWMLVRGLPFRNASGQVVKWIGTCTDIHDLKETADQLASSTTLLRMAGKIARIGGWAIELPHRELSWSDEVFEIMEFELTEPAPALDRAIEMYSPGMRQKLSDAVEDCITEGKPFELELEVVTARNRPVWVYVSAEAVRDLNGDVVRVQGAVQDITAAKVAELSAQENAERIRVLSLATKDAIWDFDRNSGAFWLSDGFRDLLGFNKSDDEMTTEALIDIVHPDDRDRMLSRIRNAIAGSGEGWSDSYRLRRQDGSYLNVVDRGFLVREPNGKLLRIIGGITDISERLKLEEQLRQSRRLESLGQLTGGVAHDFNNLLGVISGNLELVAESLGSRPDLQEMLQAALRATDRGATLTRSMLAFARQQPLDPRALEPNSIMREMLTLLRRTLPENIEIKLVPGSMWSCDVDPGQLQNALLNLAVNARDAMPDGGRLTLETADATLDDDYATQNAEVVAGDYVMLAISDTGSGMTPDVVARIFEPFFTTKEVGKGTGLGMSMVYGFAKQSLGHVKIYSEVDEGTTVRLYLPRSDGKKNLIEALPISSHAQGRGETILVVEDDEDMRIMASDLLRSLGYSVVDAAAANTALDILRQSRQIDLLLTDVILPGLMNGRKLADEATLLRPNLKVVYMSGYTENAILHHGRLDPGVHLLQKPFSKRELAGKLREVLE